MIGENTKPLVCQLAENGWEFKTLENSNYQRVIELLKERFSQTEIVEELNISKGQVSKLVKKAKESGDYRA